MKSDSVSPYRINISKQDVVKSFHYKMTGVLARKQIIHPDIDLKNKVCGDDPNKNFIVINQKGVDPISLDMFQKAGIVALRRAKKRNMERLILIVGGLGGIP